MPEVEKKPNDTQVDPNEPDALEDPEIVEAPFLEPEGEPEPQDRVHPLKPGGYRFEQVYAKGKQAEREAAELRLQLAEAQAKLIQPTAEAPKEYTWAELETFIQQGRITRADAETHREEVNARRIAAQVKGDFTNETRQATREQALTQTIQEYLVAVPAAIQDGSADRLRLDEEFDWLASVQGLDPTKLKGIERKALQATALRNVYGPIDSLRKRSTPPRVQPTEGLPGGNPPQQTVNKDQDLLNKLTKPQVAHYKKMMAAGRYKGGWKDVVAEIKWQRKKR